MEHHNILNAHTEASGQVYARFRRTHGPLGHWGDPGRVCTGRFMDIQTQAVAESVAKIFSVAGVAYYLLAAASISLPDMPARATNMPLSWAFSTRAYTLFISSVAYPTATVRVMSEQ